MMLDIVRTLREYLNAHLDCEAYAEVPRERPERFVTIERTGGGADEAGYIDRPNVAVQSWAPSNQQAYELAAQVDAILLAMPYQVANLARCERNTLYNFPDPDSRTSRYQGLYEFVTN